MGTTGSAGPWYPLIVSTRRRSRCEALGRKTGVNSDVSLSLLFAGNLLWNVLRL